MPRVQELFKQLRETAHQKPAQYVIRLSLLSFELLLLLAAEQHTFEQKAEVPERLARVFAYARQILDHPLSVADLAAVADCTPTHLNRLFTAHVGMHAHEWIEKTKMERAATLLRTRGIPICRFCDLVGYEAPYHFSHAFKRVTGMSPSQYRTHSRRVIKARQRAARGR